MNKSHILRENNLLLKLQKHSRCKNKDIMSVQFNMKPKYGNHLQLLSSKLFLCLSLFISSHFIYTRHNTSMMLSYYPPVTLATYLEKNAKTLRWVEQCKLLALSVTVWSERAKWEEKKICCTLLAFFASKHRTQTYENFNHEIQFFNMR